MRKSVFYFATFFTLILSGCSGDDNSSSDNNNPNTSQILGKWIIYKAIYEGNTQPVLYEINGSCGREVLEFFDNKTVNEDLYIDSNCTNGVGSEWDWWSLGNSRFAMGYTDSDTFKELTISENELIFDGTEEWGVKKYYKKVE